MRGGSQTSDDLVTVGVVDDHPFFRDGLIRGLTASGRVRVVGDAGSAQEGLELIRRERPQVAVVDYAMPGMTGADLVRIVTRDALPTRILMLSADVDGSVVYQTLQDGASGYLSKDSRRSEIVEGVLTVAQGRTVLPPELALGLVDQIRLRRETAAVSLSERESQVLAGFAAGKSIPALAKELYLEPSTVKTHTQRLYEKLGVSDRAAAVAEGMRRGLLE